MNEDLAALRDLNARFIRNYITGDVKSHDGIIHEDFVCIQNSGEIMQREEYLKDWATSHRSSGFTSFGYENEFIRIFGKMALVRSKSVWEKNVEGKIMRGSSIYTDMYVKEDGRWRCVQAQITPIIGT